MYDSHDVFDALFPIVLGVIKVIAVIAMGALGLFISGCLLITALLLALNALGVQ